MLTFLELMRNWIRSAIVLNSVHRCEKSSTHRHDNSSACQMTGFVVVIGQDVRRQAKRSRMMTFVAPHHDGSCFDAFDPAGASACHLVPR